MTKAPFSVEWLSQSSQASKQARSREDVQQADSPSFQFQEGDPFSNSQPPESEIDQSSGKVGHRAQEPPSEHSASLQKDSSSSSAGMTRSFITWVSLSPG